MGGATGGGGGHDAGGKGADSTPTDNLYINNLPNSLDEQQLRSVFGAYGTIVRCKLMLPNPSGTKAALIQFGSVSEAKWLVDNMNGNLPQGLTGTEGISVRFKLPSYGKADDKGKGCMAAGPYKGSDIGPDKGKGKGHVDTGKGCSIKVLVDGLMASGAMPGGTRYCND